MIKKLKNSLLFRTILVLLCFVCGGFMFYGGFKVLRYLDNYYPGTVSYDETYDYESLFLKYVERTSVYVKYREAGYQSDPGSIYSTSDLSSILNGSAQGNLKPNGSVYETTQEDFEYYNRLLNKECENFFYYVKNTVTGATYYSPQFVNLLHLENASDSEKNNAIEEYLSGISSFRSYFHLNTRNARYITNVNKSGFSDVMTIDNIDWIINFLTGTVSMAEASHIGLTVDIGSDNDNDYVLYAFYNQDYSSKGAEFTTIRNKFNALRNAYDSSKLYTPFCLLICMLCLLFLTITIGHTNGKEGITLNGFDHIYTEIFLFVFAAAAFLVLVGISFLFNTFYFTETILLMLLYSIYFLMGIIFYISLVRRIKAHIFWKESLTCRLFLHIRTRSKQSSFAIKKTLNGFFSNTHASARVLIVLSIFALVQAAAYLLLHDYPVLYVIVVATNYLSLAFYFFKVFADFNRITIETKKIAGGNYSADIDTVDMHEPTKSLADDINNISKGLSAAVEEKLKSERLKTELITNVSHDIKTPLTSIINYVDLLQKENLNGDTAKGYLKILTEKSWRLKTLIEDLVEASKASSGTISLQLQKLNIIELTKQALGEFEDRFVSNDLDPIFYSEFENLSILADGRSTYRIIENIFSNVYKYALHGTRVYMDVTKEGGFACILVKNISAGKLNITGDELMERFVRGDLSRNTEGSGLGLSIAKSLATLQNGSFDIILDGDLFKAVVKLPLYQTVS
ncbi:MAG: HAMP domain-containing histidine kinase [Lachnospiraceae bacterium]|nr:HAMP domain-containing histidine kinase [Lachnospiraceae bacterium]